MRCNWRRWLWGLIPLIAIGLAAVHLERGGIERDLAERAKKALAKSGAHWAEVAFDGRDANLRGNATNDDEPDEAEEALSRVWGIRDIDNNAGLPPKIEPYLWSARRRGNRVRLHGYVPNRQTRHVVIGIAQATLPGMEVVDRMHVGRGAPPADTWIAGLSFALKQLASLKRGDARLEGVALSISGEAEDFEAYRTLNVALKRGLPKGITLASANIAPPVISPFTWSVQFAGGQLVLSGHVPGESARADLRVAAQKAPAGTDIVDRMEPAQGAPQGFANVATAVLKELVRLQSGSVEMKDAAIAVTGVAADEAQVQAVRTALRAAVAAPFKLTDQLRVREPPKVEPPKMEPKPTEPAPPPAPAAPAPEAKPAAPPAAPPADPPTKLAAPAPQPPPAPEPPKPEPRKAEPPKAEPPRQEAPAPAPPPPQASPPPPQPPAPEQKTAAAPKVEAPAPAPTPPKVESKLAAPPPPPPQVVPTPPPPPAPEPKMAAAPQPAAVPPAKAMMVVACQDKLGKIAGRILFDTDSANLDAASHDTLDRLAKEAKLCPGVRIAIEGHADVEGSAEYNQRLSMRRAQAVMAHLVKAGADARQLEAVGFGSSRPAAPNDTAANKAKNRRIEIVVRP
jgi:OOP family OmpA-OmpF porin